MNKDYGNYLQFLASEYNVLYIGKDSKEIYDETSSYFLSSSKVDMNVKILDKMDSILSKRHIDIVIFDVEDDNSLVEDFFQAIKAFNDEIMTLLIFEPKGSEKLFSVLPLIDVLVLHPIDNDIFQKKLFTLLSRSYALNSIGRREIILKHQNVTEDSIEKFFDTYEGSALFLADDLVEIVKNLNDGNISHQFFLNIANRLDEIANIFAKAKQTNSVTHIYEHLASFLRDLDLEKIEPKNLTGFTYLSEILNDVSFYLLDMFVDRIFRDVYVFEHSLKNNIEFMENRLSGNTQDEDKSELEFF